MIHPTAMVQDGARIDESAEIGAYAVIGPHVRLGPRCWVGPHAVVEGRTTIGEDNRIFQFASIGAIPQHLKYAGEPTELRIGSGNTFREFVTINLGTAEDKGVTLIGNGNTFMAYCHVAHDCVIEDSVIMSNAATLAGHVYVEKCAILGGLVGVHQFCRIGQYSMVGGMSGVSQDIPPYTSCAGFRTKLYGLNTVGMKRHGFSPESIRRLKQAYKILFLSGDLFAKAVERVRVEVEEDPHVTHLLSFLLQSKRGFSR
jgi:UDP-N-acetylglucosamine acyltransferase